MKRHGITLTQRSNQRGLNIMDAVMGLLIASLMATAVLQGLSSWFTTRNLASNQDSATQYAQGVIAKAKVASWATYGFPGTSTTNGTATGDPKYAFCSTAAYSGPGGFRANVNGEPTVVSTAQPAGVYPADVVVLRGQAFCVRTDITWSTPPSVGAGAANATGSYGVKHITMKLSWQEKGKPKSITVDSTRSPNAGESIPSSIGINDHAVLPPAVSNQSFIVTSSKYNSVSFAATWKDAISAKIISSNAATFSSPTTIYTADPAANLLSWTKDYGTVSPTNAYYRLVLEDSIGLVTTLDLYEFPGSKLTINQSTKQLSWNAYGGLGTPSYDVYMDETAAFTSPTKLTTTSATSYTAPVFTGDRWFRVDTKNSEYSLSPAQSNIAQLTRPLVQPLLTCAPNSYSMDMNVAWQTYNQTWGSDVTAEMTVKNNVTGVVSAPVNVSNKNSQLHDIDNAAASATYLVTMKVTAATGATSSGTVTCDLPKFSPTVTYEPANQQMVVTSNLTFKQLGFGIASPTSYNGTTFTTKVAVKGNDYFNTNKAYPSLDKSVSETYSSARATEKPTIKQITPITGGAYIPEMTLTLPSGALTTKTGAAPSNRFPFRDFSQRADGSHQLAGVMNDALTFYDFNANTFGTAAYSSHGWGWGSAKNLGLGQNTVNYTTSSVWLLWDDGIYRYDLANDRSGNTVGKYKASQGGMDLFNNFTVVQNFFGDEQPAILAIANRTAHGWNAGDLMAYRVNPSGDLDPAQLAGWGWKNYTIAPAYDWNGYGTSALIAFKNNDKSAVWAYNIYPQGKTGAANVINSRVPLANTASVPSLWNMQSLAGGGHDENGKPVVLLVEGVAPFLVNPGPSSTPYKYNAMVLDGAGGLGGYYSTSAPADGFKAQQYMGRRWAQGNFASANNGNYCIDVPNNDGTNGNKIQLYGCNNSSAQEFKWSGDSSIMFRDTANKCIDVPGNSASPIQLQAHDCNGTPAQHFKAQSTPVGSTLLAIKHVSSGLCIDNIGGTVANGNAIRTWECNNSPATAWGFMWNDQY